MEEGVVGQARVVTWWGGVEARLEVMTTLPTPGPRRGGFGGVPSLADLFCWSDACLH